MQFGRMRISLSDYHSLRYRGEALYERESLEKRGLGEESLERGLLLQLGPTLEASPIRYGGDDLLDENPIHPEREILWCEFHSLERG